VTVSTETAPPDSSADSREGAGWVDRLGARGWYLITLLAVALVCAARIAREPRFFFWDDTQLGAFGQWYGLGTELLSGRLPILAPGFWQGGNYLAEGQWGIWNPVTWLIALGTHAVGNATIYSTLIKVLFLLVLATGAYLLAREYGAAPSWSALAGLSAAMGGQTIFMDAPSWVTGLQNVALFALCWWALKRHVDRGTSPIPFFVFAYLLVTFGYVFGVIELAVLLFLYLIVALLGRAWALSLRVLVLGAFSGLLTVVVYLPGLLTSPVTARAGSEIMNDQFLNMDLGDLATSTITTAASSVRGYWGDLVPVPLQYVSWLLPLLVLFLPVARRALRDLAIPLGVLIVTLAFVLGPSVIGPIRYPARMMPYAVLAIAVVFAVVASRSPRIRADRGRVWLAIALTAVAAWLSWAAQPASWPWVVVATVLQIAVILVVARVARRPSVARAPQRVAALLLVGSLVVLAPQVIRYGSSPLGNFNVPSSVSAMNAVGGDLRDGIMTVGDVYSLQAHPDSYQETLLANLWYLTGKETVGVYTVLPFRALSEDLCLDLRGRTCPEALDTLFEDDDHPVADDLALNALIVIKGAGLDEEPEAPEGWTVTEREHTWLLERTETVESAGGIARMSDGVRATVVTRDDTSVTFSVDEVPEGGGEVVFSRLAWPGYTASGGDIVDPERGYLLTVELDEADEGTEITVRFLPPGWVVEAAAAVLAAVIGVGWTVWFLVRRRRADAAATTSAGEHVGGELGSVDRA